MSDHGMILEPGSIRFERLLPGPIERVWAYLTESDQRGLWLAAGPVEPRVGGRVSMHFRNSHLTPHREPVPEKYKDFDDVRFEGRVTRWEPPRLLSHTWGESSTEDSEVTFELTPRGDQVLLVLTHRRLVGREQVLSVAGGWHTHLGILADRLHGREPGPFWSTHARLEEEYGRRIADA